MPPRPLALLLLVACAPLVTGVAARTAHADKAAADLPAEVKAALDGLASADRETRQAAAEAAAHLTHPALLAALQKAGKDEYRSVREAVFRALGTRVGEDEGRKAARTLEARLKEIDRQPEGKDELLVVVAALQRLARPTSIDPLLEGIEVTTESDVARARLEAVAHVPSKEAVERLIAYAARGRRGESHRAAALRALETATQVKLGNLDAWHRWWAENKRTFDPEAAARVRAEADAAAQAKDKEREARRARRDAAKPPSEGGDAKPDAKPEANPDAPPEEQPTGKDPAEDEPREQPAGPAGRAEAAGG